MRISDWSSDVCSSDLRGSRIVGGRVVPRCSKRRSLFNTGLDRHLGASRDGGSINLIIGTATARAHRGTCRVDFALQKLVVLPRLALTLDELTHQLPHHLRCWPVRSLSLRHELIPQFGLQFHRELNFFGHGGVPPVVAYMRRPAGSTGLLFWRL